MSMINQHLHIEPTDSLISSFSSLLLQSSKSASSFNVALSGGSIVSFISLCIDRLVGSGYNGLENWNFYFIDERYVNLDSNDSNYKLCNEKIFIPYNIKNSNIYPLDITNIKNVQDAAEYYSNIIKSNIISTKDSIPSFDLVILGIGPDGHCASLFPNHILLKEESKIIASISDSPKPPSQRITFTLPLIKAAKKSVFIVIGESKAERLVDMENTPALLVSNLCNSEWYIDEDAGKLLKQKL